jgi:hypothetical protein
MPVRDGFDDRDGFEGHGRTSQGTGFERVLLLRSSRYALDTKDNCDMTTKEEEGPRLKDKDTARRTRAGRTPIIRYTCACTVPDKTRIDIESAAKTPSLASTLKLHRCGRERGEPGVVTYVERMESIPSSNDSLLFTVLHVEHASAYRRVAIQTRLELRLCCGLSSKHHL